MAGEATQPGGQDPQAGQGQDPTTQAPPQAGGTTMTLEAAQEALAAARREAAAHRTEAAALKKEKADAEAAKLSDLEKAQRERDVAKAEAEAIKAEARERVNRYEVQLAASRLGIVDPEAAVKLLDWDSLEYSDDGSPKGVDAALKKLLAAKPYLAAQAGQAPAAGATNPASGRGAPGLTLEDIKKMSRDQINARWREVSKVLERGY